MYNILQTYNHLSTLILSTLDNNKTATLNNEHEHVPYDCLNAFDEIKGIADCCINNVTRENPKRLAMVLYYFTKILAHHTTEIFLLISVRLV